MKCLTHNLEVNYPCSPVCPLFGDCIVAFRNEQKKRVRTNADCIRGMSDEELAEFICGSTYCQDCPHCGECDNNGGWLNWLQQPAEEGDRYAAD